MRIYSLLIEYQTGDCGNLGCQNGGSCVASGLCNCAPGFTGENCQRRTCPDLLALNGNVIVTPVSLEVKCHEGYILKSGKGAMEAKCQAGEWTVPPEDLQGDTIACIRKCEFYVQKNIYIKSSHWKSSFML